MQRRPVAGEGALPRSEDHVCAPRLKQLERLEFMVDRPQIDVDVRADAPEPVEDLRHPAHGDAGIGCDADGLRRFFRDRGDLVLQPRVCAQKFADGGHERIALLGQGNAAVVTLHQRQTDLPFQTVDQMRQPRLRIADDLRRSGKTAEINGCH